MEGFVFAPYLSNVENYKIFVDLSVLPTDKTGICARYADKLVDSNHYQSSCSSVKEWNDMIIRKINEASIEIEKATRKK